MRELSFMVIGHAGGWDEILLVVGPLAVLFLLLMAANRRAKRVDHSETDS